MPETIDATEFAALRIIVQTLIAREAVRFAVSDAGPPEAYIDSIAKTCKQAISTAQFSSDTERSKALDHVNHILGGIEFPARSAFEKS
jgi:hypothetical protein